MPANRNTDDDTAPGTVIVRETRRGMFQQDIITGAHRLLPTSR